MAPCFGKALDDLPSEARREAFTEMPNGVHLRTEGCNRAAGVSASSQSIAGHR
ncbi:hypothetical protein GCM10017667_76670 [Streptomyces filamentosus]|uniref:Uncharacterized protein n=1 Tax=Streptomyces filamentosus TaxID=67294 RepID=A0A919BY33_STRFL|nr:hypothetical protein GCM10017667_76670 [Streptomyces filamentosus]